MSAQVSAAAVAASIIDAMLAPPPALTTRERQVVECLLAGMPNKILAHELGISENTAKHHIRNICDKTGADDRLGVALWALREGGFALNAAN